MVGTSSTMVEVDAVEASSIHSAEYAAVEVEEVITSAITREIELVAAAPVLVLIGSAASAREEKKTAAASAKWIPKRPENRAPMSSGRDIS